MSGGIPCVVCGEPLAFRLAHGRKSRKHFVMLICPVNGRHFRAFINDQEYVRKVIDRLEDPPGGDDPS